MLKIVKHCVLSLWLWKLSASACRPQCNFLCGKLNPLIGSSNPPHPPPSPHLPPPLPSPKLPQPLQVASGGPAETFRFPRFWHGFSLWRLTEEAQLAITWPPLEASWLRSGPHGTLLATIWPPLAAKWGQFGSQSSPSSPQVSLS